MTHKERYLFDLMGFIVLKGALSPAQVTECNEAIDRRNLWEERPSFPLGPYSTELMMHIGPLLEWGEPFRGLMKHPLVLPYLSELIGESMRLDHDYVILARPGAEGGTLHEGNTPYNPACSYHFRNGRFYNGLIVVSFALNDVGAGDGGFCCIAGSHKSNVERPPEYMTTTSAMAERGPWLVQPPLAAGDALIFTEALTHGTMPWSGGHERRALFYKYSPGNQSWSNDYRAADEEMDETQRLLMEPPYVYKRQPVMEVTP